MKTLDCRVPSHPQEGPGWEPHSRTLCAPWPLGPPVQGPQCISRLRFDFLRKRFSSERNLSSVQSHPENRPSSPPPTRFHPVQEGGGAVREGTPGAEGATSTSPIFFEKGLIQSHPKEELPGRWMPLQILPSTWNASDCLLNCSSKRKHWQANIIKMEAEEMLLVYETTKVQTTYWGELCEVGKTVLGTTATKGILIIICPSFVFCQWETWIVEIWNGTLVVSHSHTAK